MPSQVPGSHVCGVSTETLCYKITREGFLAPGAWEEPDAGEPPTAGAGHGGGQKAKQYRPSWAIHLQSLSMATPTRVTLDKTSRAQPKLATQSYKQTDVVDLKP